MLPASLGKTLSMIAGAARVIAGKWWIIGSVAVALHRGVDEVADVDL